MKVPKAQFQRLFELDRRIRSGEYPNCTSFSKEWEVSRKTVQRDIEFLRDTLGAPIEYNFENRGYHYTEPSWTMPGLSLTEGEILQLLLAERMARQYEGTPIAGTLESLFEKINALLRENIPIDMDLFRTQFSFLGKPSRTVSEKIWLPLFRTLRNCRVIRLIYRIPDCEKSEKRTVEPVHLASIGGEWYLVAWCRKREDLRNFAVSRIKAVGETDETFPQRHLDPEEYFSNRFSRFVGKAGKTHKISIRFSREIAPWVLERSWHPMQTIKKHRDGRLTISFPAPVLYEVKRWVLQWGAAAEVIAPTELREEIENEAVELGRIYG